MVAILLFELDGAVEGAEDPPGSGLAVVQDVWSVSTPSSPMRLKMMAASISVSRMLN
jgi:hypothetical protein